MFPRTSETKRADCIGINCRKKATQETRNVNGSPEVSNVNGSAEASSVNRPAEASSVNGPAE
jgi:hypothetical protein